MSVSQLARSICESPTLKLNETAAILRDKGEPVIHLGGGEPKSKSPIDAIVSCSALLNTGDIKYSPPDGIPALKKAIIRYTEEHYNRAASPDNVIVSSGAKQSIMVLLHAILDPKEEVIFPAPYWVSYPEMVKIADGVPVYVESDDSTGFTVPIDRLRAAVTPKTRMLILNSPSNPTGGVYDRRQIEEIAQLAVDKGFYVLSDEIYEKIIYDGREHVSIASLGPEIKRLTITVNGFSKAFSMTGWRLGYVAAEKEIVDAMDAIQSHSASNMVSFTLPAGVAALKGPQDVVASMVAEFDKRRRFIVDRLNSIDGITCAMPGGAFYVFPNVSGLFGRKHGDKKITGSDAFADFALEVARVSLTAGSGFGADNYVRLSYATSMEAIEKGTHRLAEAVAILQ